jgi:hypothetical protein
MFIGHYGVALASKRASPRLSLGALFLAVQLLDVFWAIFVLMGIEKLRIVHNFTAYNPYDLYWMPYTHSLPGAAAWSVVAALACWLVTSRFPSRERRIAAAVFGAAVFSHFLLDALVHTPDLPLGFNAGSSKIGLGLWNHRLAAIAAELVILVAGGVIYLRATRPRNRRFAVATTVFSVILVLLLFASPFQPDPPSDRAFAIRAVVSYVVLAVVAGFIDRGRPGIPA